MFVEKIIDFLLLPLSFFVDILPTLSIGNIPSLKLFISYIWSLNEVFPIAEIISILIFNFISVPLFSALYTLILKIKSFIPTMGD